MTVSEAVRTVLLSMAPVTSAVSSRVWLVKQPQHSPAFPLVLVQRIDQGEDMHMRGGGVKEARVRVTSVSHETENPDWYATARSVDAAVDGPGDGTGLCGYTGAIGSPSVFDVRSILPVRGSVREGFDPDELQQFKIWRDYEVRFTD